MFFFALSLSPLISHASRAEEARTALALEIRANEVEPQRRRADAAEAGLSELRQAAHGWLSAAQVIKLEASAEARAKGYSEGRARGRSEGELEADAKMRSLRAEVHQAREAFLDLLARSQRERLSLREEAVEARNEAVEMVAAVGAAGAAALAKSRDVWVAQGRAEGFASGLAEGLAEGSAVGREEGRAQGRADAGIELGARVRGAEEREAAAVAAASEAGEAEVKLREAFAAYVVNAHEQKLRVAGTAKEESWQVTRGLSEELASAREMLAELLKVSWLGTCF